MAVSPARLLSISGSSERADIWSAHALTRAPLAVISTGNPLLDAELPSGGWPIGHLIEILQPLAVFSEWRLLLPALVHRGVGPVVLAGPPHLPFVPALQARGLSAQRLLQIDAKNMKHRLWASEQALRCADVDAVLAWLPEVRAEQLRRLHVAAAEHGKLLFVMRPQATQSEASPAPLRLLVQPVLGGAADALAVRVLKRRGPPLEAPVQVSAGDATLRVLLEAAHATDV